MKTLTMTLCAATLSTAPAMAGVSPEAFAHSLQQVMAASAMDAESASGEIMSIAKDKTSFELKPTDDERVSIRVNDSTVYVLDGKRVERDTALSVGRTATVTHKDGLASRVEVTSVKDPHSVLR